MSAHALDVLTKRGLCVAAQGDRLLVSPSERLDDELRRYIRQHKPELIDLLREWSKLEAAIYACCVARKDTDENRTALLADCWRKPATDWPWLTDYFRSEAARWTH